MARREMQLYRGLGAGLDWFALITQYSIRISHSGFLTGSMVFFCFFTILGNVLVATSLITPLLRGSRVSSFLDRPGVRTAIGVYIVIVAVIFFFLLRNTYHPTGISWFCNILLHYFMPPFYVLDWLLFVPKAGLNYRQIPFWLIFPLGYAAFTLLHGAASGYYPYLFMDAGKYGYGQIAINVAALSSFFILVSLAFVATAKASKAWVPGFRRAEG